MDSQFSAGDKGQYSTIGDMSARTMCGPAIMHVTGERRRRSYPVSEGDMGTLGVTLVSVLSASLLG